MRPGGGAALAPLRTFRGATVRERTREARCSQWPFPLASRATKQTGRKGAPDSVSRSVVGEGAQSCCKKHRKTGCSCCRSRTPSFADRVAAAPDSVSHSVVREGAQAAARDTVKRGAHAAAPAPQASLTVSRQPSLRVAAKCGVCIVLAEAWSSVRATAKASAGPRNRNPASHGPLRCTASQVQRCAGPPRHRNPGYDLHRAPCIHPHFASNAICGGLNQRFL